jgi:hypothetical protein
MVDHIQFIDALLAQVGIKYEQESETMDSVLKCQRYGTNDSSIPTSSAHRLFRVLCEPKKPMDFPSGTKTDKYGAF